MKSIIYILLLVLAFGCQKESSLKSELEYEQLYAIEDDPSDSVKHRIYEIYQRYAVPVYFNDTIGRVFIKNDIYGNPVYSYELLDLSWSFTSYSEVTFRYEYMTDPAEQMKTLDMIEEYLKFAGKALWPYNFFVVESVEIKDDNGEITSSSGGAFNIYFRSFLMTGKWSAGVETNLVENMMRGMVKNRIMNYKDLLEQFNKTSKAEWYDVKWTDLDSDFNKVDSIQAVDEFGYLDVVEGVDFSFPGYYVSTSCFSDTWWAANEFTPVGLEKFRAEVRRRMGRFGFLSADKNTSIYTPYSTEQDLIGFITEMLDCSREEFERRWGDSPLVMKKYGILYDIVANKLGVEL